MEMMQVGDPLPDWFMEAMSKNLIIITHKDNYNSPFDNDMSQFYAFVWDGEGIRVATVGDFILNNENGTYSVRKQGD